MRIAILIAVVLFLSPAAFAAQSSQQSQQKGITREDYPHSYVNKASGGVKAGANKIQLCERAVADIQEGLYPTTWAPDHCLPALEQSRYGQARGKITAENEDKPLQTVEIGYKQKNDFDVDIQPADLEEKDEWEKYYQTLGVELPTRMIQNRKGSDWKKPGDNVLIMRSASSAKPKR